MNEWMVNGGVEGGIAIRDGILLFAALVALFVPFTIRELERRHKKAEREQYRQTLSIALQSEISALH